MKPWIYLIMFVWGVVIFYVANETLNKIVGSDTKLPSNIFEVLLLWINFMGLFIALLGIMGAYNIASNRESAHVECDRDLIWYHKAKMLLKIEWW